MTSRVQPIPAGYHSLTPYLIVDGAAAAIDFYKTALGAKEVYRLAMPDGRVAHAEIKIGDSPLMLADESPAMNAQGPRTLGGSAVTIMHYVEDVDRVVERAVAAGAKVVRPVQDQFYGDRSGSLEDPFGHKWVVSTRKENLTSEQIQERALAMFAGRK